MDSDALGTNLFNDSDNLTRRFSDGHIFLMQNYTYDVHRHDYPRIATVQRIQAYVPRRRPDRFHRRVVSSPRLLDVPAYIGRGGYSKGHGLVGWVVPGPASLRDVRHPRAHV